MTAYIKISTGDYPRYIGDIELDPAGMEDYAIVEPVPMPALQSVNFYWTQTKPIFVPDTETWREKWVLTPMPTNRIQTNVDPVKFSPSIPEDLINTQSTSTVTTSEASGLSPIVLLRGFCVD